MTSKIINTSLRDISIPCKKEAAFSKSENDFIEKYSLLHEQTYNMIEESKQFKKQLNELNSTLISLKEEFPLLRARREKIYIIENKLKEGDAAFKSKYQLHLIQTADMFNIDLNAHHKKINNYSTLAAATHELLLSYQKLNEEVNGLFEDIIFFKDEHYNDKSVVVIDFKKFEPDYNAYEKIFEAGNKEFDELWDGWTVWVTSNNLFMDNHNSYFNNLADEKKEKEEEENNQPMEHPQGVGEHYIELAEKFEQELKNDAITYKDVDDWNLLIDYYIIADNNNKRIEQCIEWGLKQHPDDQRLTLRSVGQLYDRREFKKGLEILAAIQAKGEPLHPSFYAMKGLIYDELEKPDEAIEFYKKTIESCDESTGGLRTQNYMNLSLAYKKQKHYQDAIDLLKDCKSKRHHSDDLINELCYNYELAGQKEECIPLLEEFLTKNPQFHKCWLTLGNCYADLGMNEKAIEAYSRILETDKESPQAYVSLGETYRRMEKFSDAVGNYQKAIASDPMQVMYYICLAFAYDGMKDYSNAIAAFRDVLKLDPESEFARGWIEILKEKVKPE
jgi:tetratricopeptide (TPR) repeat protein